MALQCALCGKKKSLFESFVQCVHCGTVYCRRCYKNFKYRGLIKTKGNTICPKCGNKGFRSV